MITKCPKHPKYKAKRVPKNPCVTCLRVYIAMGKMTRKPLPPRTQIIPDKTKYSRKRKHKNVE